MERTLNVDISVNNDGSAKIEITDNDSSDSKTFTVAADVNCNDANGLAEEIGYEFLSWVDIAREDMGLIDQETNNVNM